jgi:peptidoglycan/LPS O-acetylase OafA/YrhL
MRIILVKEFLGVGVLVLAMHILALKLFLYWTTDWYDIVMHALGGFLIGLIVIAFIRRAHISKEILNKNLLFLSVILAVLVIALSWELWEIFIGWTDVLKDGGDTILDVIMGLIGGVVAILYYYFKYSE